jgi:integrase
VSRLDQSEVERLAQTTYRNKSKYGLMIKTLFQSGARVSELRTSESRIFSWTMIHHKFTLSTPSGAQNVVRCCLRK